MDLSESNGRWLVTKSGYELAKKLNKTVEAPSTSQPPGAPTTEPPSADYTVVTPASTTLLTAELTKDELNVNKAYYSRVKYSDDGITGSTISSKFSVYNEFTTADSFVPEPGEQMEGGYFGGQINDGGTIYNLIVAPSVSGSLTGQTSNLWKTTNSGGDAGSAVYGKPITDNKAATVQYPIFQWCNYSITGPNANNPGVNGTGIGGFNDWYIPAKNELAVLYFFLKPSKASNDTLSGSNPNAVDPYTPDTNYGPDGPDGPQFPNQTSSLDFQSGSNDAFFTNVYWSATEDSAGSGGANTLDFTNGEENAAPKGGGNRYVRVIRRVAA